MKRVTIDSEGLVVSVEATDWTPTRFVKPAGLAASKSVQALRSIKPGETVRLVHPDINCHVNPAIRTRACSLLAELSQLRKKGWKVEQYHEKDHVAVIRRLE